MKEEERRVEKARKMMEKGGGEMARRLSRGKGKMSVPSTPGLGTGAGNEDEVKKMSLVVFACRHVFHRVCLDPQYGEGDSKKRLGSGRAEMYRCPICPGGEERKEVG